MTASSPPAELLPALAHPRQWVTVAELRHKAERASLRQRLAEWSRANGLTVEFSDRSVWVRGWVIVLFARVAASP